MTKTNPTAKEAISALKVCIDYIAKRKPCDSVSVKNALVVGRILRNYEWSADYHNKKRLNSDDIVISRKELEKLKHPSFALLQGILSDDPNVQYERGEMNGYNQAIDDILKKGL